ncbi:MAG: protein-glutamate O-methyltransferase CheR [Deltaproteobacteria bacterium]
MKPGRPMTPRRSAHEVIRRLVAQKSAIVLDPTKDYLIDNRLAPVLDQEGIESMDELVDRLDRGASRHLISAIVDAMTTNESYFFRDTAVFKSLEKEVLPDLIERRKEVRRLRIWSAACSSGQEPYSLAMLLDRVFPYLMSWDVKIVASDISASMVERTREGLYTLHDVNRGVPPDDLRRYFVRESGGLRVRDSLRRWVEPRIVNLIEPWDLEKFDLILMRNVLIYFDISARKRIVERCPRVLARDGILMIGAQETLLGVTEALEHVTLDNASAYRVRRSF